ncbi:MAG: c-type cytochrome [Chitinophagales bacterium]|nr:c-type cytochrome [Chitinophagales bacterium]
MKKFLKVFGIILFIIVIVVIAFISYLEVKGIPSYEAKDPGIKVQSDSAKIANGKRLSEMLCRQCHYNDVTDKFSGKNMTEGIEQFGTIYSANITQDKDYGIGSWTDGQLMWLLRTGIKRNGGYAPPWMPKLPHMSDYDVESIIAFLHSNDPWVQAASVQDTASAPSLLAKFLTNSVFKPLPYPSVAIPKPDTSDKVVLGRYIVTGMLDCYPCHSADFKTMNIPEPEKSVGFMGGGNMVGLNNEKQKMYSANLTPDRQTGIGGWTEEQFINALRFGQKPDGHPVRYPMIPYPQLSETEVKAVFAYLMQIPPIHNQINNPPQ